MAGYAFARMRFPGKNVLFALTLGVLMIPANLIIIPKFLVAYTLHMTDIYAALVVPAMVSPVSVILMTQFMKALPRELEESARIDGAGRVRTFFQIILPLVRPAMTAVGLLAFQGAWNDFLWSLLVMSSQQNYTLNVGLSVFKGLHYTQYQLLLAGATISLVPLVVVFFVFQRYFMQGIATAGLAGGKTGARRDPPPALPATHHVCPPCGTPKDGTPLAPRSIPSARASLRNLTSSSNDLPILPAYAVSDGNRTERPSRPAPARRRRSCILRLSPRRHRTVRNPTIPTHLRSNPR